MGQAVLIASLAIILLGSGYIWIATGGLVDETNGAEAAHPCDQFPVTYERLTTDLYALPTLRTSSLPARAVDTIERCSARRPYGAQAHPETGQPGLESGRQLNDRSLQPPP